MTEYYEPKDRADLIAHYRRVKSNLGAVPPVRAVVLPKPPEEPAPEEREMYSLLEIMAAVAYETQVPVVHMRKRDRHIPVAEARHLYCAAAFRLTYASLNKIAHMVGLKDHTTVMHAVKKVDSQPHLMIKVLRIQRRLDPKGVLANAVRASRAAQRYGESPRRPPHQLPPVSATGGSLPATAPGPSSRAETER